jgi:translation initiation factor 3 subunit F
MERAKAKGSTSKKPQPQTSPKKKSKKKLNLDSSPLFLDLGFASTTSCRVHPVVIFNILDQYIRRNDKQNRVIGTLLGINNDGIVEISNCYPVPLTDEGQLNRDYFHNMLDLHYRAAPQESVVGWYATGDTIDEQSVFINDFYWKEMQAPPLHLIVDTVLHNDKLGISAFVSTSLSLSNKESSLGFQFRPILLDFAAEKPEKTALDILTKGQKSNADTDTLLGQLDSLEISLKRLIALVDTVSEYVDRVNEGKESGDPQVGRLLLDTVSSLPKLDSSTFEKTFSDSMKDLLMVVYLANLTRTQLTLAQKLNLTA